MSYEGYEVLLCEKGHVASVECCESKPPKCEECSAPWKWAYPVDETNGVDEEAGIGLPPELRELSPSKQVRCSSCKQPHLYKAATFAPANLKGWMNLEAWTPFWKPFWMVLREGSTFISHRHPTLESARQEAARLSRKLGVRFYILEGKESFLHGETELPF